MGVKEEDAENRVKWHKMTGCRDPLAETRLRGDDINSANDSDENDTSHYYYYYHSIIYIMHT